MILDYDAVLLIYCRMSYVLVLGACVCCGLSENADEGCFEDSCWFLVS